MTALQILYIFALYLALAELACNLAFMRAPNEHGFFRTVIEVVSEDVTIFTVIVVVLAVALWPICMLAVHLVYRRDRVKAVIRTLS